jgi:hypothetical protein
MIEYMVHGVELQIGRKLKPFRAARGDSAVIVGSSVENIPKGQDQSPF